MHRLSIYVVVITTLLTILALAASVAIGLLWTSSFEPTMDGQKVLELQKGQAPMAGQPDAH